jgi:hypothetical protein
VIGTLKIIMSNFVVAGPALRWRSPWLAVIALAWLI